MAADVGYGDGDGGVAVIARGLACRGGFHVVEWGGAVFGGLVEVELGCDGATVDVGCVQGGGGRRGDCLGGRCRHCNLYQCVLDRSGVQKVVIKVCG